MTSGELSDVDHNQLRQELIGDHRKRQTPYENLKVQLANNPFLPIGCAGTVWALTYGLWHFKSGRIKHSQRMMRVRLLAQGFTIAALVYGVFISKKSTTDENAEIPPRYNYLVKSIPK